VKDQAQSLTFDLGEYLPFQLSVIAGRVFQRVMEDAGLQVPEWRIMMALPANQPCSSHDLCILTAMDAARVSRAQRRLEDLELISVIRDKIDRRTPRRAPVGQGHGRGAAPAHRRARRRKRPARFARPRGSGAAAHRHRRDLRTDLTLRTAMPGPHAVPCSGGPLRALLATTRATGGAAWASGSSGSTVAAPSPTSSAAPGGQLVTTKLLSEDPAHYADAAVEGIRRLRAATRPIESVKMGTTVATNALLERKGARVLLLMTEGFGDLLRIGTQARPRLFDLEIRLPELLYEQGCGNPRTPRRDGAEIAPLTTPPCGPLSMRPCRRHPVCRHRLHAFLPQPGARDPARPRSRGMSGFAQISPSHEASRLIKLVGRGDTAVVDAYLSPILRRYVGRWPTRSISGGRLRPALFHAVERRADRCGAVPGRDAILSGPGGRRRGHGAHRAGRRASTG
jgi:hypothetical protein